MLSTATECFKLLRRTCKQIQTNAYMIYFFFQFRQTDCCFALSDSCLLSKWVVLINNWIKNEICVMILYWTECSTETNKKNYLSIKIPRSCEILNIITPQLHCSEQRTEITQHFTKGVYVSTCTSGESTCMVSSVAFHSVYVGYWLPWNFITNSSYFEKMFVWVLDLLISWNQFIITKMLSPFS